MQADPVMGRNLLERCRDAISWSWNRHRRRDRRRQDDERQRQI